MPPFLTAARVNAFNFLLVAPGRKRRNPKIIAGTLAFMLAKNEGRFLKVKPSEIEPLREALHFLRRTNVHIRTFWTSWEKFEGLWHNLQVPRTSATASPGRAAARGPESTRDKRKRPRRNRPRRL